MNIFGFIVNKFKVFSLITMVFLPCFVEATPFKIAEVPSEFVSGNPLFFGLVSQDIDKMVEVPIVADDGGFGDIKGFYKGLSSFDLPFSSGVPTLEDDIPNENGNSSRSSDYSTYDWCFHFSMYLLLLVSMWSTISIWSDNFFKHND